MENENNINSFHNPSTHPSHGTLEDQNIESSLSNMLNSEDDSKHGPRDKQNPNKLLAEQKSIPLSQILDSCRSGD